MRLPLKISRNERGSVMNVALLVLLLLAVVVIYMSRTSTTDVKIASNVKAERIRFYQAESGVEVATEIFEQNIACPLGFATTSPESFATNPPVNNKRIINNTIVIEDLLIWQNPAYPGEPSDANRQVYYPLDYGNGNKPHTNLTFGGIQKTAPGASLQMAAGYEGKGKGAAGGGVYYMFDIYSQYLDSNNSEAMIWIGWLHLVGQEDACKY